MEDGVFSRSLEKMTRGWAGDLTELGQDFNMDGNTLSHPRASVASTGSWAGIYLD
jgi:hypothetical protein